MFSMLEINCKVKFDNFFNLAKTGNMLSYFSYTRTATFIYMLIAVRAAILTACFTLMHHELYYNLITPYAYI